MSNSKQIIIVGAGCFGLSTAHELLVRGYTNVKIIDRANDLPAPDAASTDINRIVRSGYYEKIYARLARESIAEWKTGDWDGAYHECGVAIFGTTGTSYSKSTPVNDISARVTPLATVQGIKSAFPGIPLGDIAEPVDDDGIKVKNPGSLNLDGGWVGPTTAMNALLRRVRSYPQASIITGYRFTGLATHGSEVVGIRARKSGEEEEEKIFEAEMVVLATGAWSPSLLPDETFGLSQLMKATGQSVLIVQLTPEEKAKYDTCPVVHDASTGFYTFPPTASGLLKWSLNQVGAVSGHKVSTPRTGLARDNTEFLNLDAKIGADGEGVACSIPKSAVKPLRDEMRKLWPEIADRDAASSRMCWYSDTVDGNWIIDFHPVHSQVLLATGGSGHAFKFLPVLGRIIADRLEDKLGPDMRELFSFSRSRSAEHSLRLGEQVWLDESELTSPGDLKRQAEVWKLQGKL